MTWGKSQDEAVLFYYDRAEGEKSAKTNVVNDRFVVMTALNEWFNQHPNTRTCKIAIDHTGIKCTLKDVMGVKMKKVSARSGVDPVAAIAWALWKFLEVGWK